MTKQQLAKQRKKDAEFHEQFKKVCKAQKSCPKFITPLRAEYDSVENSMSLRRYFENKKERNEAIVAELRASIPANSNKPSPKKDLEFAAFHNQFAWEFRHNARNDLTAIVQKRCKVNTAIGSVPNYEAARRAIGIALLEHDARESSFRAVSMAHLKQVILNRYHTNDLKSATSAKKFYSSIKKKPLKLEEVIAETKYYKVCNFAGISMNPAKANAKNSLNGEKLLIEALALRGAQRSNMQEIKYGDLNDHPAEDIDTATKQWRLAFKAFRNNGKTIPVIMLRSDNPNPGLISEYNEEQIASTIQLDGSFECIHCKTMVTSSDGICSRCRRDGARQLIVPDNAVIVNVCNKQVDFMDPWRYLEFCNNATRMESKKRGFLIPGTDEYDEAMMDLQLEDDYDLSIPGSLAELLKPDWRYDETMVYAKSREYNPDATIGTSERFDGEVAELTKEKVLLRQNQRKTLIGNNLPTTVSDFGDFMDADEFFINERKAYIDTWSIITFGGSYNGYIVRLTKKGVKLAKVENKIYKGLGTKFWLAPTTKLCTECGASMSLSAEECPHCAHAITYEEYVASGKTKRDEAVQNALYCPKCHSTNYIRANKCAHCGIALKPILLPDTTDKYFFKEGLLYYKQYENDGKTDTTYEDSEVFGGAMDDYHWVDVPAGIPSNVHAYEVHKDYKVFDFVYPKHTTRVLVHYVHTVRNQNNELTARKTIYGGI